MRNFATILLVFTLWCRPVMPQVIGGKTVVGGKSVIGASSAVTPAAVQGAQNCSSFGTSNTTVTVGGTSGACGSASGWGSNVGATHIIAGYIFRAGPDTMSVSDGGDTCVATNSTGVAGASRYIYGFYCYNVAGGSKPTITATFGVAQGTWYATVEEISGVAVASPLDSSGANTFVSLGFTGTGANAWTSGNWTTSTNGDYVLCGMMDDSVTGGTISAGTISQSWALLFSDNTHNESMSTEGGVQTTASASTVCAFTNTASGDPLIGSMAFKHQ